MKKLLLFLLVAASLQASAQLPGATTINSRYDWLGGRLKAGILPAYCDTSQYPTNWVPRMAGHYMLDTCGSDKGTLYVKYDGYWKAIVGSGGGGTDTTGYGYLDAVYPLVLTAVGDTARLSIETKDLQVAGGGGLEPVNYSTITDGGYYQGFPSSTVIKDTIYTLFKRGVEHVAPGWVPLFRSFDGGIHWDSLNTIVPKGVGSAAIITAINDTLFTSYDIDPSSTKWQFGYSSDYGKTFVKTDSLEIATWRIVGFGKYIKMPSGRILLPAYLYKSGFYSLRVLSSPNGRTGWASYATINEGATDTLNLNELWIEKLETGATTDAQVRLICVARDELLNGPVQFHSTNGGLNWTRSGRINQLKSTDDVYGFPVEVKQYGGQLYLIAGVRTNIAGGATSPLDMYLGWCSAAPDSVFTNPAKWSTINRIYNSEANTGKGIMIDFGYFFSYVLNGALRVIGYDISPGSVYLAPEGSLQILSMPLFDLNHTEVYALANQSISANTETLVGTPYISLNTQGSFNSGTGLINIKQAGVYQMKGSLCFQAGAEGTYRKAYIKVINPGYSAANRIVSEVVLQPTENLEFCRAELNAEVYLKPGEQVGMYVLSDAAAELRNQQEQKNKARLTVKSGK